MSDSQMKVLLVDDDRFFRSIMKDTLVEQYSIIEAADGEEALGLIGQERPDLVVMDVEMPRRNGIEVCKILKQDPAFRRIPVILVSANDQGQYLHEGLHAGADDYISKPVDPLELLARVDSHLRLRNDYTRCEEQDLRLLLELTEAISSTRNPLIILRTIVEKISEAVELSRCSIVTLNDNNELIVKASSDLPFDCEVKLDLAKYPEIFKALRTKRTVIVNDVKHAPEMRSVAEHIKDLAFNSIIVVPILKKDSVIGTFLLRAASPLPQGISSRLQNLCQLIAHVSANALENAILIEAMKSNQVYLEERALRDGLTGLYNHQFFYTCLEREFSRSVRYDLPLVCFLFDIDNFKEINDQYGHVKGDEVLRSLGRQIAGLLRESDVAARYGGEEFAIILPNTSRHGARDLADRLMETMRTYLYQQLGGRNITVSLGISCYERGNLKTYNQLVVAADEAMYRAKAAGKDRYEFSEPAASVTYLAPLNRPTSKDDPGLLSN